MPYYTLLHGLPGGFLYSRGVPLQAPWNTLLNSLHLIWECCVMKRINVPSDLRGFILIVVAMAGMSGILLDSPGSCCPNTPYSSALL